MRKCCYMMVITIAFLLVASGSNLFTPSRSRGKVSESGCKLAAGECFAECVKDFGDCLEDLRSFPVFFIPKEMIPVRV